jgi:hypothetical protein
MSQRGSGYERKELDSYETPKWVTRALLPHLNGAKLIWEPACGSGKMAAVLRDAGFDVCATDIVEGCDFLVQTERADWIVTNPPYAQAQAFIEHALRLAEAVAMLLRCDFDHAKGRQHLFGKCPAFAKKIVLTRRIVWFDGPKAAPSYNHAWFLYDHRHRGPPTLAYAP